MTIPPLPFASQALLWASPPPARLRARRGVRPAFASIVFLLALLPLLAGCGFHPLYADARLEPQLASIFVEPVAERDGYELRNTLINLLASNGESGGKAYRLKLILNRSNQGVALQNDATITRYNDTLTVTYVLTDAEGKEVTRGTQTSLASYNTVNSPYATLAGQQDADKRAAEEIAERIRLDMGVFFHRRDGK
jgi:LPS-assembly lipoprotein